MRPGRCVQSGGSGDDCAACCNVGTDHDGPPQDYRDIASPPPAATARGPYTGPHPDDVREACEAAKAPPAATASDPREPGTPDGKAWRDLALRLRAEVARLTAERDEAIDLLRECAPLTDHNSDAPPPHRLCLRCGVDAALASVERGAQ